MKVPNNTIKNISSLSDEELIIQVQKNNEDALEFIISKYKDLVRKKARTYYLIGADKDDIIQEGMIGLYKAIRDYKHDRNTSFKVFAEVCITRQIISAVKASTRQKHTPLNTYISLNKPSYNEDEKDALIDRVSSNKMINPEDLFIDKENVNMLKYEISNRLSPLEKKVLIQYLDGQNYIDISRNLNKSVKSIDNALQRIKKKVELLYKK